MNKVTLRAIIVKNHFILGGSLFCAQIEMNVYLEIV